ncbi:MAG: hypothetical protein ACKOA8_09040 [Deltaproteobacteria bacterium]
MAQRDRNQGFGFMYADITKLIAKKKEMEKAEGSTPIQPEGQTLNFNRDKSSVVAKVASETPSTQGFNQMIQDRANAISTLKDNLDRLQTLHHKLHSMLDELNKISDRDSKKK